MRKLEGYAKAEVYQDVERLPIGGYVLRILGLDYVEAEWGDKIVLSFDVEEGEFKGFYTNNYKAQKGEDKKWKGTYRLPVPRDDGSEQDGWKMRKFKTVISAIEESNPGYHFDWDEKKLKGKIIGGVFNNKEYNYNNRRGFFTNCHSLIAADKIRAGKFGMPADTLLDPSKATNQGPVLDANGFMHIPDGIAEELPF